MLDTGSVPKQGETTFLWLVKIITGPILLVVAFVHLIVNHYIGSLGGLQTYNDVVAYYKSVGILVMEAIFLFTVLIHSLIGLRGIVLDLRPSPGILSLVNWVFVLAGLGFGAYGFWLLMAVAAR